MKKLIIFIIKKHIYNIFNINLKLKKLKFKNINKS